jgi:hypothetical protein
VLYYTTQEATDVTNAIFLLGAFLCLKLGATPTQAWQPFSRLRKDVVLPYRDATWVRSTYDLHVQECWAGLVKAVKTGMYVPENFDKNEVHAAPCPRALHRDPRALHCDLLRLLKSLCASVKLRLQSATMMSSTAPYPYI